MLGRTYDREVCSIARTLELVGERWSLLILRNAVFAGCTRFGDFQRSLGIATNVLTDRLDAFVSAGLMRRQPRAEQPELHEYVLTDKGHGLAAALIALTQWGDDWAAPDGPPIVYRHVTCGAPVRSYVECDDCGEVDIRDVQAHPGPGMPADRAERITARLAAAASA